MRRAAWIAGPVVTAALAAAGCGVQAADLFVLTRTGSIPEARLALRVSDDGFVRCNGGKRGRMSDRQLLQARDIVRGVRDAASKHVSLPSGPDSVLRYRLRLSTGTVSFSDDSRGQSKAMFEVQDFTRNVARHVCGLAR